MIPNEYVPRILKNSIQKENTGEFSLSLPKAYADWQKKMISGNFNLAVFAMGTKAGKTLAGASRIANFSFKSHQNQAPLFRIIAPTYQQSSITFQYLTRLLPEKLPAQEKLTLEQEKFAQLRWSKVTPERSDSKLWMRWPHNRAKIQCVHASDPEVTIEGERTHGNLIDEAAKCSAKVFSSVTSTTTQTGGWIAACSTPRGKNHFYDLWRYAKDKMEYQISQGLGVDTFAFNVPTETNPFIKSEVITQAKSTLPDRLFRQLFLAEFVDDGSVLVGHRQCVEGEIITQEGKIEFWEADNSTELTVVIGVDWAKRKDSTVFYAIDISHPKGKCAGFRKMQGLNYTQAVKELYSFGKKFAEVSIIKHDRTGVGDVLDEMLSSLPFSIEPVVFTNTNKTNMVDSWSIALEKKQVILPNWRSLLDEHDDYDVKVNQHGRAIYGAINGKHDDIVTACFLAWSAFLDCKDGNFDVNDLDDFVKKDSIEDYYKEINSDDDDDLSFNF